MHHSTHASAVRECLRQQSSTFSQDVVKEDFDPDRFISVFEARNSSQLAWLDDLKADAAGRQLIYQLSATHRSCLVLNFAIQKILRAGTCLALFNEVFLIGIFRSAKDSTAGCAHGQTHYRRSYQKVSLMHLCLEECILKSTNL